MCWTRLKRFLALSVLYVLLLFLPSCFPCFADVRLTDEEATQLMEQIQGSKKDLAELQTQLETVQTQLTTAQEQLKTAQTQLDAVKSDYNEQKKSYEMQLTEAEKSSEKLKIFATATSTSSVIFCVLMVVFMFI